MSTATHYVDVVILKHMPNGTTNRRYTYAVPPAFQAAHHRGRIVSVNFGKGIANAVVLHAHDQRPQRAIKDILAVSPLWLTPHQISLCEWVARHHATSLVTALELFLPSSIVQSVHQYWQVTAAGLQSTYGDLPVDERGILYLLRTHGQCSTADLQQHSKQSAATLRSILNLLASRGLVTYENHIDLPQVNQTEHWVTLDAPLQEGDVQWFKRAPKQHQLYQQIANAPQQRCLLSQAGGRSSVQKLLDRRLIILSEHAIPSVALPPISTGVTLNPAQQQVVDALLPAVQQQQPQTTLLHGITGSGKTEIYFALIDACIAIGKQVLVLVPEIALTTQLAQRFQQRFPGRVHTIHGQITPKQRRERWLDCLHQRTSVVLGPRSALSVPLPNLGLIVVDEEHDASLKYEQAPYLHARNAALVYAKIAGIPIVLGSATPSVELMYAAREQRINYVNLNERINHEATAIPRPPIRIVDMRTESCIDRYGLISQPLATRITHALAHDERVLLLLNRRGNSGARICRNCGTRDDCPRCSAPLVTHLRQQTIIGMCHTCGLQKLLKPHCEQCFHSDFLDVGSGTQRVCQVVAQHFPQAHLIQWDRDTANSTREHAALLSQAQTNPRSVIVGTQMVAKGLDIAQLTVVGVINTDTALALPDFRTAEHTYQLLTQVAGRAGRRDSRAEVFFQSYQPEHYAIQAAARYQDTKFYDDELAFRAHLGYPPYSRMIKLTWMHRHEHEIARIAQHEAKLIGARLDEFPHPVRMIGPAPAFFHKVRDTYRWHLILVGHQSEAILEHIAEVHHAIVDVDPVSLL